MTAVVVVVPAPDGDVVAVGEEVGVVDRPAVVVDVVELVEDDAEVLGVVDEHAPSAIAAEDNNAPASNVRFRTWRRGPPTLRRRRFKRRSPPV